MHSVRSICPDDLQIRDALTKDCDIEALREMLSMNDIDVGARPRDALVIVRLNEKPRQSFSSALGKVC
jgi:hypothetical protein